MRGELSWRAGAMRVGCPCEAYASYGDPTSGSCFTRNGGGGGRSCWRACSLACFNSTLWRSACASSDPGSGCLIDKGSVTGVDCASGEAFCTSGILPDCCRLGSRSLSGYPKGALSGRTEGDMVWVTGCTSGCVTGEPVAAACARTGGCGGCENGDWTTGCGGCWGWVAMGTLKRPVIDCWLGGGSGCSSLAGGGTSSMTVSAEARRRFVEGVS